MFHITRKFCRNILPEFTAQSGIDKLYPTTDSEYRLVSFHGFVKDKHFHFVTLRAALPNRTHYEPNYRNKQTILQNRKHQKGEKEMERSLTNNHILNADRLTKAQFNKAFTDMMKSKGYTKATDDDAVVSYSLVFTKDRKWVTVTGEDINAAELAKSLSMQVLPVELVDSDFCGDQASQ